MSYNNATTPPPQLPSEGSNAQPMRYASFQHRLGALVLDAVLMGLTLGIGWLIWSFIIWGNGQTPAKQILKIRVYNAETGRVVSWGHMALREALLGWWFGLSIASGILSLVTFGLGGLAFIAWYVIEIVFYFTKDSRTLRDLWAKTAVINVA
jgi:uncharacterized RDD family membrane protein YckC